MFVEGPFESNIMLTIYYGEELTSSSYVDGVVQTYDYVDIRFFYLSGVCKLCADKGFSSKLFCYKMLSDSMFAKIVLVKSDDDFVVVIERMRRSTEFVLYMDNDHVCYQLYYEMDMTNKDDNYTVEDDYESFDSTKSESMNTKCARNQKMSLRRQENVLV